jgi:hypothetical protein
MSINQNAGYGGRKKKRRLRNRPPMAISAPVRLGDHGMPPGSYSLSVHHWGGYVK